MTDQADMEARAQAIFESVLKDDQFIPRRRDIIAAMHIYAAEREAAAYARAAEVARDRADAARPYANGIGMGPHAERARMTEAEHIARAIEALGEAKGEATNVA